MVETQHTQPIPVETQWRAGTEPITPTVVAAENTPLIDTVPGIPAAPIEAGGEIPVHALATRQMGAMAVGASAPEASFSDRATRTTNATEVLATPVGRGERGAIDFSKFTLTGLRKSLTGRLLRRAESQSPVLHGDAEYLREAAAASMDQLEPPKTYDPLATFGKNHMVKRPVQGEPETYKAPPAPVDVDGGARTELQKQAALRANLRVDAVTERRQRAHEYKELYKDLGIDLSDKDAVKAELSRGRYTRGQKKAMRAASRQVRKTGNSSDRIGGRLERSATGENVAGRIIGRRIEDNTNRADRLENHIQKLDQKTADKRMPPPFNPNP